MQHSTVRSIIIWLWKDQLASGLIEVTKPNTNNQGNNTLNYYFIFYNKGGTPRYLRALLYFYCYYIFYILYQIKILKKDKYLF